MDTSGAPVRPPVLWAGAAEAACQEAY